MHQKQPWRFEGEREIEYKPWKRFFVHLFGCLLIFILIYLFFYSLISTGSAHVKGWSTVLTVHFSTILSLLFTLDAFLSNLDEIIVRTLIKHYILKRKGSG